jgi:hypothetical protein
MKERKIRKKERKKERKIEIKKEKRPCGLIKSEGKRF